MLDRELVDDLFERPAGGRGVVLRDSGEQLDGREKRFADIRSGTVLMDIEAELGVRRRHRGRTLVNQSPEESEDEARVIKTEVASVLHHDSSIAQLFER